MDTKPTLPHRLLPGLVELGSTRELTGVLPCERLDLGSRYFALNDGIPYELTLTNTGGGILLAGNARATGTAECARCLEDASFEVQGEVEGYFILDPDRQDERLLDDEFTAVGADGMVDLGIPIVAAVIYELPQLLLCREDCAGLCPVCGANLNERRCDCATKTPLDGPFAVLGRIIGESEE
jgi:uncharacterized protein